MKKYKITIKDNFIDIDFKKDIKDIEIQEFVSGEEYFKLIDEIKEKVVDILLDYDEAYILINKKETYLLLSIVDEFADRGNINIILKVDPKETNINNELVNMLSNMGIEMLIETDDKNVFIESINKLLENTLNEIEQTNNSVIIIHPVYEIILLNLIRKAFGEENFEIDNIIKYYDDEKKDIIKSVNINDEKLKELFKEFFESKKIIGNKK